MRIVSLIIVLFLAVSLNIEAQQDSKYSQYVFNGVTINPAYVGMNEDFEFTSFYKKQWMENFDGVPKTFSLTASGRTGNADKIGIGGVLQIDQVGANNIYDFSGIYAYNLRFNKGTLSTGIQGGVTYFVSDLTSLITPEEGMIDPEFIQDERYLKPNFGLGLYWHAERFFFGLSVPHLMSYQKAYVPTFRRNSRHYFIHTGYVVPLSESMAIKPFTLIQSLPEEAPFLMDIGNNFYVNESLVMGITYRFGNVYDLDKNSDWQSESLHFLMQYNFDSGMKLGYAYYLIFSDVQLYNSGTHEIMIGYKFINNSKDIVRRPYF